MSTSRALWMRQGKFGVMVHWCVPKTPPQFGKRIEDINEATNRFDLDRFIGDFRRTQADWLIFTIGQTTGYVSPNGVMDALAGPGHCTERDLIQEITREVKKLGKRMVVYLHCTLIGTPGGEYKPNDRKHFGFDAVKATPDEFLRRYADFIAEYSRRWGKSLDGWWFDGASTEPVYHDTMLRYLAAARAGNPDSAVALNDGSFCLGLSKPVMADQDYIAGEVEFLLKGKIRFGRETEVLNPATHVPQPPPTCLWHALIPIDAMWEHGIPFNYDWQKSPFPWVAPEPHQMEKPIYTVDDLETVVRDFKSVGGGVTFNVGIFQEGGLGPQTVDQLAELAARVK
jgi:hypothetical protein